MRDAFLLDPDVVFLNHGSFGACAREVFAQYQHWQLELERNPVDFLGRRFGSLLRQARRHLAEYLVADADDLVFVPNATTGVNLVARSLPLQPGDEILASDHEYGACDATWQLVCRNTGARYRRLEIPLPFEPAEFTQRVLGALTPQTKVIYLSHVTSTTALTFPLQAICEQARERGIVTLIDGAHAPGYLPLDVTALGADYYTGNCHKWMCAPKGSAFLHARPSGQAILQGTIVSWGDLANEAGHSGFDAFTGRTPFERRMQWQGTRDIASYLSVPAAIDFEARHDWPSRRTRCEAMAWQALQDVTSHNGLSAIAPRSAHGQMVAIPVRSVEPEALQRHLFDQHRIEVPVTQHAGRSFVRLSVQAYNSQADVDALVSALTGD